MVSNTEGFTDNSQISPGPSMTDKKPIIKKSLHQFYELLNVKQKTAIHRLGAAKSKQKATIAVSMLWYSIPKSKGHTKINERVKKDI